MLNLRMHCAHTIDTLCHMVALPNATPHVRGAIRTAGPIVVGALVLASCTWSDVDGDVNEHADRVQEANGLDLSTVPGAPNTLRTNGSGMTSGPTMSAATAPSQADLAARTLATQNAAALVASRPALLNASSGEAFAQRSVVSSGGVHYVPYERTYDGLPVVGGDFVVVTDDAGQVVFTSSALDHPIGNLPTKARLTKDEAEAIAMRQLQTVSKVEGTQLVVNALGVTARLAWESTVDGVGKNGVSRLTVDVDAVTGALLRQQEHVMNSGTAAWNGPNPVTLNTTKSGTTFLMRDPTITNLSCQDSATNAVFSGPDDSWGNGNATSRETGCVDALFGAQVQARMLSLVLGRNGMDGAGGAWPIRVGLNAVNAFYDGTQVQIGHNTANQWIGAVDIIAHEMGHGIDDRTPGGISGSGTQEFIADAFGAATEWFANEPAPFDVPDFTVGERVNLVGSGPIRNMFNPSALGDPNCYSSSIPSTEVHAAAGPGNHWFYLLAQGSNPTNGPASPTCNGSAVAGLGMRSAIKILYSAMLMKTTGSSYLKYRTWTLQAAKNLYRNTCKPFDTVKAAWDAVGVPAQPSDPTCQRPAPRTSDILWHNVNTGEWTEWIMGNGAVAASIPLYTQPLAWQVPGIGDFNGDGTSDFLWHNVNTGEWVEWIMKDGTVAASIPLYTQPLAWQVPGIGDFNGDGTSDILWHNVNTGEWAEWLMGNGAVAASIPLYTQPLAWQVPGIGDFNGDGTSDLLWHNVNTGEWAEWLMGNGAVAASIPLYTQPLAWQVPSIGDLDGDGTSDLLWHNVNTGEWAEWLMRNGAVATSVPLYTQPLAWQVPGIGDFNGDGTGDLLWHNVNTGEWTEWLMGDGAVAASIPLYTQALAWQVPGIGDFNGR
jgi:zinc metalloprotease ZmpA